MRQDRGHGYLHRGVREGQAGPTVRECEAHGKQAPAESARACLRMGSYQISLMKRS